MLQEGKEVKKWCDGNSSPPNVPETGVMGVASWGLPLGDSKLLLLSILTSWRSASGSLRMSLIDSMNESEKRLSCQPRLCGM